MVSKIKQGYLIGRDPIVVKGREDSHHYRKNYSSKLEITSNGKLQLWDGRFVFGANGKKMKMVSTL